MMNPQNKTSRAADGVGGLMLVMTLLLGFSGAQAMFHPLAQVDMRFWFNGAFTVAIGLGFLGLAWGIFNRMHWAYTYASGGCLLYGLLSSCSVVTGGARILDILALIVCATAVVMLATNNNIRRVLGADQQHFTGR